MEEWSEKNRLVFRPAGNTVINSPGQTGESACNLSILQMILLLEGIGEVELMLDIFLSSDQGGLWELLIEAGDFYLLAILGYLFGGIVRSELLQLLLKLLFEVLADLVGAFADDADSFVDISGLFGHGDHIAGHGSERSVSLLVIHILYSIIRKFRGRGKMGNPIFSNLMDLKNSDYSFTWRLATL